MPDIYRDFLSGVLSADPGTAGTVLNSGNFGFMPAIVAPNTMRLVLDPEGTTGVPEIVIVTAHTAFATSCTVLRGQETAYGAGAARAHAVDSVWRHSLTVASILEMIGDVTIPAGAVSATLASTPDAGHLFLDGSTVTNAQVLYPATWARIPTSMKSGADMLLPDARGATLMMDDAGSLFSLAQISGANSRTIAVANLPASGISIDPPNTTISIPGHSGTTDGHAQHHHTQGGSPPSGGDDFVVARAGGGLGRAGGATGSIELGSTAYTQVGDTSSQIPNPAAVAAHVLSIPGFSASVDIAAFTTPNLGSGVALDTTPRNLCINWQIKCH